MTLPPPLPDFRLGDRVRLRSGGPVMEIREHNQHLLGRDAQRFHCYWQSREPVSVADPVYHAEWFGAHELEHVSDEVSESKQPNPCPACGAFLWDDPRPCWNCARAAAMGQAAPRSRPLTVVEPNIEVTLQEMAERVLTTRREHEAALQAYHTIWYNAPHTWHYLHFLGVGMMKCPNDIWMYQQLMTDHRPQVVIETGTYQGGSALWFAYLMDMLGIKDGRVFTVDIEDHRKHPQVLHPRITYLAGDSRDPELVAAIREHLPYRVTSEPGAHPEPVLVVLDADHSADHVRRELELYAPLVPVGSWLVVEDTNIAWDGPGGDRGARGGLEDYLREHPGEWRQDVLCERWLLTMNPGGWLQRMKECDHP